jgi:hypothetical protein
MSCLCGTNAGTFLSCLRRALGVAPAADWNRDAHVALYNALASIINVQDTRRQTPDEIRAVAYAAEPEITGVYAGNYPTRYLTASNSFWTCIGVTRDDAVTQASRASGPYYDAMVSVMNHVRGTEEGTPDKPGGVPWWAWLLVGGAVGAGVYLVVRK